MSETVSLTPGSISCNSKDLPPLPAQQSQTFSLAPEASSSKFLKKFPVRWELRSWTTASLSSSIIFPILAALGNAKQVDDISEKLIPRSRNFAFAAFSYPGLNLTKKSG